MEADHNLNYDTRVGRAFLSDDFAAIGGQTLAKTGVN
jgi:hypothetical protein